MDNDKSLVTGMFPDRESAELGYHTLAEFGYTKDDVKVVMSENTKNRYFTLTGNTTKPQHTAITQVGAVSGSISGALLGWNLPDERIRQFDAAVRKGVILIGVRPRNLRDAANFENAWRINGALAVHN